MLCEYVEYYNSIRTHQTLGGNTPIESKPPSETNVADSKLSSRPILGGLYHDYKKAA